MENENGEQLQLIQCLECGKIFDRGFRTRQKFCCKKCRLEYNKHDEEYKERERIKRRARWRKKKTLYCLLCGQAIDRTSEDTGSSRMHDRCVVDDALSTLRAENRLSSAQVSRVHAYGHTVSEMINIICKEIESAKKPKNVISKDTAVEQYHIPMPTLNSLIYDDKIRIYNRADYGKNDSQRQVYVDASELEVYLKKRNVNRKNKRWVNK